MPEGELTVVVKVTCPVEVLEVVDVEVMLVLGAVAAQVAAAFPLSACAKVRGSGMSRDEGGVGVFSSDTCLSC